MSADAKLVEEIKHHFSRKTSAQLREILQCADKERWSPEAFAAADELLMERRQGSADEPATPEPERLPPTGPNRAALAMIFGMAHFGGPALAALAAMACKPKLLSIFDAPPPDDCPIPFGSDTAWLAVFSKETGAVAASLHLHDAESATWKDGLAASNEQSLFVTPPLADWTLIVGKILFPPTEIEFFIRSFLEILSRQFDDVQFFCNRGDNGLNAWARARKGRLIRGYCWSGEKKQTIWEFGDPTKEERDLALDTLPPQVEHSDDRAGGIQIIPDDQTVFQLAYLWSIDPSNLTPEYKEPVTGIVGQVPRG
jgi:hypothetical protein